MKKENSFDVDFNYALSEHIAIRLTANVQLKHSFPRYLISNFHFKEHPGGSPPLPDLNIMAVQTEKGISWVHIDSRKETLLSAAVGKAIEAKTEVEVVNPPEIISGKN